VEVLTAKRTTEKNKLQIKPFKYKKN